MKVSDLLEARKFGHDTWNIRPEWDADQDPGYIEWLTKMRHQEGPSGWKRGPHEGRYLNLMLKGLKPAAIVRDWEMAKFEPHIKSGEIINVGHWDYPASDEFGEPKTKREYFLTLPGEEWRGRQLMKIWKGERKAEYPANVDAVVGKLLGMSNAEVRYYIGDEK